jgi:hypothetical protein
MAQTKNEHWREKREEFFDEHFPYEVDMLRGSYQLLQRAGAFGALNQDERRQLANALIESFCVHARNLIDFFKGKSAFIPRDFTIAAYRPPSGKIAGEANQRITWQISHFTANRTKHVDGKIDDKERREILLALEREIQRFREGLTEDYKARWRVPEQALTIKVGEAGASSAAPLVNSLAAVTTSAPTRSMVIHSFPLNVQQSAPAREDAKSLPGDGQEN